MTKAESIAAANALIAAARTALIASLDAGLATYTTAVRALVAAEALPADPDPPPDITLYKLVNATQDTITIQRLTAEDVPLGDPFNLPSHSEGTMDAGQRFLATGISDAPTFSMPAHSMLVWNVSDSVTELLPLDLTGSSTYPHQLDWGINETKITAINGTTLDPDSGNLADLDAFAAYLADYFDATCTNIADTTLELQGRTTTADVTVTYNVVHESLPEYTMTLAILWPTY